MAVLGRYWADASSIGPVPAQYWHIMARLWDTGRSIRCLALTVTKQEKGECKMSKETTYH